jgi:hypothetical protein
MLCLALPGAFELETWDHPTFRVGGGRDTVKADPVEREALLAQGEPF